MRRGSSHSPSHPMAPAAVECARVMTPETASTQLDPEGNTEGTPTWASASTPGQSSSGDSFSFREFFGRRDPLLPALPASSLDGKEGVDGSSPSEGSSRRKIPVNRDFCCPTPHHRSPPHYRREGYPARCAAAKPLQIDLLPGTSEHLPRREGIGSRVARRGLPRTAWTSVMWRGLAREVRVGLRWG